MSRLVWMLGLLLGLLGLTMVASPTAAGWQVLAPAIGLVLTVAVSVRRVARQSEIAPIDDIGVWHMGIIALYGTLPLAVFLAVGMEYTPLNDSRLYAGQPSPDLVARVGWYHFTYLISFAIAYLWTIRRLRLGRGGAVAMPAATAFVAVCIWVGCELFFVSLGFFYRLAAESYFDSYVVVQQLPLAARQLYKLMSGLRIIASLVVLVWLFMDYRRRRWLIALGLLAGAAEAFIGGGSRTSFMILVVASFILYHRLVRPCSLRMAFVVGVAGLLMFTALGILRQARSYQEGTPVAIGVSTGEFDAVFATAVDLEQRRAAHEYDIVSPNIYLSEFLWPVPSQVLPFDKIDLSQWYLASFYPELQERGGGFAFGVIAQSVVGFGWPELVIRGLLVGLVFGALTRWRAHREGRWEVLLGYLWLTVLSYMSFRTGTMALFTLFVQQFIPAALLLWLGRAFLASVRLNPRDESQINAVSVS